MFFAAEIGVLIVIILLFLQYSIYRAIGLYTALGNHTVEHSAGNSALVSPLAYVGAVGISALAYELSELREGRDELLKREEIESGEIYERESGSIGKEACILTALYLKDLNVACGMSASLNLTRDLCCSESETWEQSVHKS